MSAFQFAKSQRVIVPAQAAGAEGVQGVVTSIFDRLGRETSYVVQWMRSDATDDTGKGTLEGLGQAFGEAELLAAQPAPMVTEEEARRRCGICFEDGHMSAMETIRRERKARAAKRKRKPAGKTKPKSKRNR